MEIFYRIINRPHKEFRRAAKAARCGYQMRIFAGNPETHKAPHRITGNAAAFAMGICPVLRITMVHKPWKAERKMAIPLRTEESRVGVDYTFLCWTTVFCVAYVF